MGAAQQPVTQAGVARGARQHDGADRQDGGCRGAGVELAALAPRQLGDRRLQHVGVGQPHRQRRPRDIAGQGSEIAALNGGRELALVQIGPQGRVRLSRGAQVRKQAQASTDDLKEQVFLGFEMGIEGAARQAGGQHDVVDIGALVATQPEEAGGVTKYFPAGAGLVSRVLRHDMSFNISYYDYHVLGEG